MNEVRYSGQSRQNQLRQGPDFFALPAARVYEGEVVITSSMLTEMDPDKTFALVSQWYDVGLKEMLSISSQNKVMVGRS